MAFAQFVNRFNDLGQIHFVDFRAPADFAEQGDGQVAAEMFAKFVQAAEQL